MQFCVFWEASVAASRTLHDKNEVFACLTVFPSAFPPERADVNTKARWGYCCTKFVLAAHRSWGTIALGLLEEKAFRGKDNCTVPPADSDEVRKHFSCFGGNFRHDTVNTDILAKKEKQQTKATDELPERRQLAPANRRAAAKNTQSKGSELTSRALWQVTSYWHVLVSDSPVLIVSTVQTVGGAGDLLLDVNISSMVVSEGKIVLALGAVGRMCCRASRLSASCKAAVTRELPHSNLSFAVLVCTSFTLVGFSTLGRSVDNLWCLEPL